MNAIIEQEITDEDVETATCLMEDCYHGFITVQEAVERMPFDVAEAIYRVQEHRYLLVDAKRAWEDHAGWYMPKGSLYKPTTRDYEKLVERFQREYSADVDENYQWEYAVEQFCIENQKRFSA